MAKIDLIPPGFPGFCTQMTVFASQSPSYATSLDLTPQTIAAQKADAEYLNWLLTAQTIMRNAAGQMTAWGDLMRRGGTLPPDGAPMLPVLPQDPGAVDPGIEARFRALVRQIKAHPNYNVAMGRALGIEAPDKAEPDYANLSPELKVIVSGDRVDVGWGWQGHSSHLDMIEIHVDRGNGYTLLTYDTTPGYVDTAAFPSAGGTWTYKAIYRKGDRQIGQWSKEVSVLVPA